MAGWIKLHRDIQNHWIFKSDHRFKWWIDILLTVNHTDTKVLIKGQLIECKRGQSVMSLETWAKRWNVTKKTVKDFLTLLQNDSILVYEGIKISTRITVCNYENYQSEVNEEIKKSKHKINAEETEATPKQECKEEREERHTPIIYSKFYDEQIEKAKDINSKHYPLFVAWLFGTNIIKKPLSNVLKMQGQITVEQFEKYFNEYGSEKLKETILSLENYTKKTYKYFNLTINKWLKR